MGRAPLRRGPRAGRAGLVHPLDAPGEANRPIRVIAQAEADDATTGTLARSKDERGDLRSELGARRGHRQEAGLASSTAGGSGASGEETEQHAEGADHGNAQDSVPSRDMVPLAEAA